MCKRMCAKWKSQTRVAGRFTEWCVGEVGRAVVGEGKRVASGGELGEDKEQKHGTRNFLWQGRFGY